MTNYDCLSTEFINTGASTARIVDNEGQSGFVVKLEHELKTDVASFTCGDLIVIWDTGCVDRCPDEFTVKRES